MAAKLIMTVAQMQDRNEWLKARGAGIGGSDASSIVGVNKWKSPFQLWLEKTGQTEPEDLSDNEYIYWGHVLEEAVARKFCEVTGKSVRQRGLLQSTEHPFMLASIDRDVVGENAGLECKTADKRAMPFWEGDEIPDAYYVQCQHYMAVTGAERWYIAALIGGNHFVWKEVARNEEDIKSLIAAEEAFWHLVQTHQMPQVDASESCTKALGKKFSNTTADIVELSEDAEKILQHIDEMTEAKKELENSINLRKNEIREMLGEHEAGTVGEWKVSWKPQSGKTTIDAKKLEKDHPEIYKAYAKTGNPYRVLRIS